MAGYGSGGYGGGQADYGQGGYGGGNGFLIHLMLVLWFLKYVTKELDFISMIKYIETGKK